MFTFLGAFLGTPGIIFAMSTGGANQSCKHREERPSSEDAAPPSPPSPPSSPLAPLTRPDPVPAPVPAPAKPREPPTPTARADEERPDGDTSGVTPLAAASALTELERLPSPHHDEGPTVVIGTPHVLGGPVGDLDPPIRRMRAGFRACYARSIEAAEDVPDASTLSLRLSVMPNGSVRSVTAQGVPGVDPSAVDCIVRRAQMTTFPASMGDSIEIVLPLTLHP